MADAAYLLHAATGRDRVVCLYITLSRVNAKRIIWPELLDINHKYKLGGVPNIAELSLALPNGSMIYLSGAKDEGSIENFRGLPIYLCIIDEAQSFRSYIQNLIDDIIAKALFDYGGSLAITGTPGAVPVGYFYDMCHSAEYEHFAWTFFQNPWIQKKSGKTPQELLEREMKRKGVTIDDPTIQRECFGVWAHDPNALVFRYNPEINHYDSLPTDNDGGFHYIIGVDLGFDDADAISVIGWPSNGDRAYLIEEDVRKKQGITDLAAVLSEKVERFNPLKIVMDTGGLGKKIAETINQRFRIGIIAAEKNRKFEFIELLNDAMRTRKFMARRKSRFAEDCALVEWDRDCATPKIKDTYHSDICDSVLYAFRESLHWLHEAPSIFPKLNSPEWYAAQEKEFVEKAEKELSRRLNTDPFSEWEDDGN